MFLKFKKKRGVPIFHIEIGRVGKISAFFKKKAEGEGAVSLIFILTNPFQCYLSLSVWCVCVCVCMCILFICTIYINIICVSQEKPSLTSSNQQIHDFFR